MTPFIWPERYSMVMSICLGQIPIGLEQRMMSSLQIQGSNFPGTIVASSTSSTLFQILLINWLPGYRHQREIPFCHFLKSRSLMTSSKLASKMLLRFLCILRWSRRSSSLRRRERIGMVWGKLRIKTSISTNIFTWLCIRSTDLSEWRHTSSARFHQIWCNGTRHQMLLLKS